MSHGKATPGVSREVRISDEGLRRLDASLRRGARVSDAVLAQWLRRYGDAARELMKRHGVYHRGLEE